MSLPSIPPGNADLTHKDANHHEAAQPRDSLSNHLRFNGHASASVRATEISRMHSSQAQCDNAQSDSQQGSPTDWQIVRRASDATCSQEPGEPGMDVARRAPEASREEDHDGVHDICRPSSANCLTESPVGSDEAQTGAEPNAASPDLDHPFEPTALSETNSQAGDLGRCSESGRFSAGNDEMDDLSIEPFHSSSQAKHISTKHVDLATDDPFQDLAGKTVSNRSKSLWEGPEGNHLDAETNGHQHPAAGDKVEILAELLRDFVANIGFGDLINVQVSASKRSRASSDNGQDVLSERLIPGLGLLRLQNLKSRSNESLT